MAEPLRVVVAGIGGRMGRMLVRAVDEAGAVLHGATVRPGHLWAGREVGQCLGGPERGVRIVDDPLDAFAGADAVLDFTTPAATVANAAIAAQARLVHVIGTTGLADADIAAITAAGRHATVIRAGNMSLGVNLLAVLARQVAAALGSGFDAEIVEMHHRMKVDAPSGTALMLGEAIAEGRGLALADAAVHGRHGMTGPRVEGTIGFAALRGGDVAGEHDVIFAGTGERVILRHVATDRMIFARGAMRAAVWGRGRKPGCYSMADVLGLS